MGGWIRAAWGRFAMSAATGPTASSKRGRPGWAWRIAAPVAGAIPAILATLVSVPPPAYAETWRSLPPFEVSAYRLVTQARDATGTFLNPAGLAGAKGSNLYLDLSGDGGEILEGTAALQGGAWAFGYRHRDLSDDGPSPLGLPAPVEGNVDSYVFAAGLGPPKAQLGLSRAWSKVDLSGKDASVWNASFTSRTSDRVTVAALVENIQKPRFLDGRLRPRYTYGVGIDLLPDSDTQAVISLQGSHEDGASDRIDLAGGIQVKLASGLDVAFLVRDRFDQDLEFAGSISHPIGVGTVSGRARSVSETDDVRGQLAVQLFDPFWRRAHQGPPPGPKIPGRPRAPRS